MGGYWVQNTASEVPTQLVNRDAAPVPQGDWLTAPAAAPSGETFLGNTMQSAGGAAVANPLLIRQAGGQWLEDGSVEPDWMRKGFPSRAAYDLAIRESALMASGAASLPEWQSVSPQENLATGKGFGPDIASELNVTLMRPNSAVDQALYNQRFNTQEGYTRPDHVSPPWPSGGDVPPSRVQPSGPQRNDDPVSSSLPPSSPGSPPRGPQPNDDPVSPSLPSPKPLPPGSVATPILDGAGNQVATKVTLPDGRTVWNIPNKNWDGSFGFPWTPPANFDLPAWLRDKTEGRPAPVQQDALRNRAQALPQQNLGQQIQQQVRQQMQQPVPVAPALPVAQGVPNAQALRESILQNMPGR
jgi:hypothetical protein